MSPFQCFLQQCHCVTTGYGSTCLPARGQWHCKLPITKCQQPQQKQDETHICKIQIQKQKMLLKQQLEAVANRMVNCFTGTSRVQPTCSLCIICSGRLQPWAQRANFMNGPHWVAVWSFNGLMFPICSYNSSALLQQLLKAGRASRCSLGNYLTIWGSSLCPVAEFPCDLWPVGLC